MSLYNELKQRNITFVNNPPRFASYIMEDGKYLDIDTSRNVMCGRINPNTKITHAPLDVYCKEQGLVEEQLHKTLVKTDNAIAINDGTNFAFETAYFILPEQEPTNAQYTSLLQWLDSILTVTNQVQIEDDMKHRLYLYDLVSLENDNGYTPEQIIQDIKRMYAEAN